MNIPSDVVLTRDGLSYVSGSNDQNINAISGLLEVTDSQGNTSYTNLNNANFVSTWFNDFVVSQYGASADSPLSTQITLTPAERVTEQINFAQPNGEPTTANGIVSQSWEVTIGSSTYTYKYLIDGMNVYLMRTLDNQSWDVSQINGFPVNQVTVSWVKSGPVDGIYTYTLQSGATIGVNKSVIAYDSSQNLANQIVDNRPLYTNTTDEAETKFTSSYDLTGKTVVVCDYYNITGGPYFGYDTSRQNYQVLHPLNDLSQNVYNTNPDDGKVVFQVANTAFAETPTYYFTPLYKMNSVYQYSSSDFATVYNLWQFSDINGDTKYIKTGSNGDIAGINSILIDSSAISNWPSAWDWPMDCSVTLTVFNDLLSNLSPQLFNIVYKNSGEEEQTVQFSSDQELNWQIRGLADLSFIKDQSCELYENQTLTIIGKNIDGSGDFTQISFEANGLIGDESAFKHIYLYSSEEMVIEGFVPTDVWYYDINNEVNYPLLLVTLDKYTTDGQEDPQYTKDCGATKTIQITKDINQLFAFSINSPGSYIFEIKNYQTIFNFQLTPFNGQFTFLQSQADGQPGSYQLNKRGVYQFLVDVEDTGLAFTIQAQKDDPESEEELSAMRIEITPLSQINKSKGIFGFKDKEEDAYVGINTSDILSQIKKLSVVNDVDSFNYFYNAPESKIIENPLIAYEFNNPYHFYNPFTICKVVEYDILGDDNIHING